MQPAPSSWATHPAGGFLVLQDTPRSRDPEALGLRKGGDIPCCDACNGRDVWAVTPQTRMEQGCDGCDACDVTKQQEK